MQSPPAWSFAILLIRCLSQICHAAAGRRLRGQILSHPRPGCTVYPSCDLESKPAARCLLGFTTWGLTSMAREDFSYESARLRALGDFTKVVVVPTVIPALLVRATKVQLGYYTVPFYGLCIFLGSYLQGLYRSFQLERDAKHLAKGKEDPVGSIPV